MTEALTLGPEYDGLFCLAWEPSGDDSLRVTLQNFDQGCGVKWGGDARIATDGTVELDLVNQRCQIALCGNCVYDATFEVRGVKKGADTRIRIGVVDAAGSACPTGVDGRGLTAYDATLPTGTEPEGVICRPEFRYAILDQLRVRGGCGAALTPCGASSDPCTACNAGLTCAPLVTQTDERCLKPCTTDSDCPLSGVLGCQGGFCRLARTW